MKICHVSSYLPVHHNAWGGAEQACYRLVELLSANNQDVTVLTAKQDNPVKENFKLRPLRTLEDSLSNKRLVHWIRNLKRAFFFPYDPVTYFEFEKLLVEMKPDVVHLHNFSFLTFSIIQSAHRLGIPIVLSIYDNWYFCPLTTLMKNRNVHDLEVCRDFHGISCLRCRFQIPVIQKMFGGLRKPFFNFFLDKITAFIAINYNSAEMMAEYGIPREKIFVIPLPLTNVRYDLTDDEPHDSILYVGWIEQRKGLHVLIKAMRDVVKEVPDAKLNVIGAATNDHQYYMYIKDLVKKYKLENNVHFLGKRSNAETLGFVRNAKVVIIPEQWEIAIPIALTEAMLLEKATVCSNIGGIPSFIHDSENGFTVDPKDPSEFAEKIVWLLKNPQKTVEMGKLARKTILRTCDETAIYNDLLKLYTSVSHRCIEILQ